MKRMLKQCIHDAYLRTLHASIFRRDDVSLTNHYFAKSMGTIPVVGIHNASIQTKYISLKEETNGIN